MNTVKNLKKLSSDSVIYGLASALNGIAALLLFPVLSRGFGTDLYGVVDLCISLIALLSAIYVFGGESALLRLYFHYSESKERNIAVSQVNFLVLVWGSIWLLVSLFFSTPVFRMIGLSDYLELVPFVAASAMAMMLTNLNTVYFRCARMRGPFLIVSCCSFLSKVIVAFIAIKLLNTSPKAFFQCYFLSCIIPLVLSFLFRPPVFSFSFWTKENFFMAARLALPLGMVTIVGLAMPFFEKAFVAKYLAFQDLSLLAAASKVGMIFALPLQAFQMAWGPLSLATSKDKNPQSFYDLVVKLYLGLGSILLFSLVVSGGYALSILASTEYERAWSMIPLSIAVVYLRGLVNFLGLGSIISFKTSIKLWSSLVSILVFFATVNIWLSCLGVFGILLATISAVLSSLLVEAYMSHKASAVSWPYKIIILSSFSVILFVLLSTYLIHNNMLDTLYLISLVAVLITSVVVCRVIQSSRKNIAA